MDVSQITRIQHRKNNLCITNSALSARAEHIWLHQAMYSPPFSVTFVLRNNHKEINNDFNRLPVGGNSY